MHIKSIQVQAREAATANSGNHRLIEALKARGVLTKTAIIKSFEAVDRADFVLPEYRSEAYHDEALPIRYGQTISQPAVVAFMLELLNPQPGEKILDVGSGSGWTTALLATIVGESGAVLGTEIFTELIDFGKRNLAKYHLPQAKIFPAKAEFGLNDEAPFDRILVSASGNVIPQELVDQLKIGGTMAIPIGNTILKVEKLSGSDVGIERFEGFVFVPLRRKT